VPVNIKITIKKGLKVLWEAEAEVDQGQISEADMYKALFTLEKDVNEGSSELRMHITEG
jgi:hypothetical protein